MPMKIGDIVEVTVKKIINYGVFVETQEKLVGLIHITKVKDDYVYDLHVHFKVGDTVTGEIIDIDEQGRLGISTIGFDLPHYEEETEHPFSKLTNLNVEERNNVGVESQEVVFSEEVLHVFRVIETIIEEELSDKAKKLIARDIEEHGIVKYVMALGKKEHFALDKGVAFHHLIMEEVNIDLSKIKFSVSSHALNQWCSDRFEGYNQKEKATLEIIQRANYGVLFKQIANHLYIRSGNYIFPCSEVSKYHYIIKTILTPELYRAQLNQSYKKNE